MSASAYRDHPVRGLISRILEMQPAPEFADPVISDNETYSLARDKVFAIAHTIHALLKATPAELASNHAMNQISSYLQAIVNELAAFQGNKNPGHISNAAAQIEQNVLPFLWGFVPQVQQLKPDAFAPLLEAQAATSRESVRQLVSQRDELAGTLAELAAKSDAQAARLEMLTEGAAKERAEAAATVAKLEQAFAQKEAERASIFEAMLGKLGEEFSTFTRKTHNASAALLDALDDQRNQAARIVQVVGNIGVTGNYQQIANAEATQANFWRWATIAFFAAGIAVAVATFVKFWGQPFTPETAWSVVIRLLYAIAITAPAWYTARESARHRTTSDRARQTELELASIGPFIELLPDEKKVQIREQLTPIYFGRSMEAHTANSPLGPVVKDIADELAKVLKK